MPFDPSLPANNALLDAEVVRNQLNALKELLDQHAGPKVYRALINQSGIGQPVATVLVNTLGTPIHWTRDAVGLVTGTLANGTFDQPKTFARIQSSAIVDAPSGVATIRVEAGNISVETIVNGSPTDDQLVNTPVEIVVYP